MAAKREEQKLTVRDEERKTPLALGLKGLGLLAK